MAIARSAVKMGPIRPFVPEDIPQVADLHRRVFATSDRDSPELAASYHTYFTEVFLDHPWREERLPSLVYQEDGRTVGFLGVLPQRMRMKGEFIRAAICSQYIVDPVSRGLVGISLLKTFLNGEQDLSLTDENTDVSRRIWERLGGTTSHLYSSHWSLPLRPARLALWLGAGRDRYGLPGLSLRSTPVTRIALALAGWMRQRSFRRMAPPVAGEELTAKKLLDCLCEFAPDDSLHSEYDELTLSWLLDRARQRRGGDLHMMLVKNHKREIAGWYLYHTRPGRIGEVLQIVAKSHSIRMVLDHLFYHAWQQGIVALTGRLEPEFMRELSASHCLFHTGDPWMLVHAKKPELLGPFRQGKLFLSKLEGEWPLRFQ